MIDSHAHIDTTPFAADRAEVLQRAWDAGITSIIIPDIQPEHRDNLISITSSDPRLYRGIGVHPHHVANLPEQELNEIDKGALADRVVAIGEIGLDYHYDFAPAETQKEWFRAQLQLAKKHHLPAIIHNREADNDILDILHDEQDGTLQGVLHCFSSDTEVLRKALDLGMLVSFTGNITFKRSTLANVVRYVPTDRFMIETDAPYITPEPYRGKRNEPAYVARVAGKIAEIKGLSMDQIIDFSTTTAKKFFALCALIVVCTITAVAQPTPPRDEDYPFDRDWEIALDNYYADSVAWEKWIKPRRLGVGLSIGTLTVVELQQFLQRYNYRSTSVPTDPSRWTYYQRGEGPERSFSFESLSAIGGTVTYGLSTNVVLEASGFYSQNTKPAKDFGLDPITTIMAEFTALYSLNPYSKINFLPQAGLCYASIDDGTLTRTKFGVNTGLGIGINIPTKIGLFYPVFNIRFNFLLGTDENRVVTRYIDPIVVGIYQNSTNPNIKSEDLADVNSIYSLPRLTILYYLPF